MHATKKLKIISSQRSDLITMAINSTNKAPSCVDEITKVSYISQWLHNAKQSSILSFQFNIQLLCGFRCKLEDTDIISYSLLLVLCDALRDPGYVSDFLDKVSDSRCAETSTRCLPAPLA